MTTYIAASLHYLEAIPPIRHLEDTIAICDEYATDYDIYHGLTILTNHVAPFEPHDRSL